jgi:hypothetical protein
MKFVYGLEQLPSSQFDIGRRRFGPGRGHFFGVFNLLCHWLVPSFSSSFRFDSRADKMGAFALRNGLNRSDDARVEVQQRLSHTERKPSLHQRFNTSHEDLGVPIVAGDDDRQRYQKRGAPMKDYSLQQQGWIVDIKYDARRQACSEFLLDAHRDIHFRWHTQALLCQRSPHHAKRRLVRLGHTERHQ